MRRGLLMLLSSPLVKFLRVSSWIRFFLKGCSSVGIEFLDGLVSRLLIQWADLI